VSDKPRKRVWVQNVAVAVRVLETRLDVAEAQGLGPDQQAAADGVRELLGMARDAANRDNPIPSRWANWWRGTLVDAAYQNLHAARAQIVDVYDEAELAAEIPSAIARAQATMHRDDPRRISADDLAAKELPRQRAMVRRMIEDGYDSLDRQHDRLRSFRNIILLSVVVITLLVGATIAAVAYQPTVMPLCFGDETATSASVNCPTGSGVGGPSSGDVLIVGLLGLLGGSLAAAVSIRNLRGTSAPYDVPVALAMLKLPLGAFTAIIGLVVIQGEFVPGLSALDSQEQILAYALILGFGQQVFTRLLDRKAQSLLDALPAKDAETAPAPASVPAPRPVPVPAPGTEPIPPESQRIPDAEEEEEEEALVVLEPEPAEPEFLPNPEGDEKDQIQDDDSDVLPDVPAKDHR
jgi:hypothetical protein